MVIGAGFSKIGSGPNWAKALNAEQSKMAAAAFDILFKMERVRKPGNCNTSHFFDLPDVADLICRGATDIFPGP